MQYPDYFTEQDIMEFEHELNRIIDREVPGSLIPVNEELTEIYYDELERDWDEPYEPETNDSWYEDQYELETY